MGRRSLRRIDPSLDLSRHLLSLDALTPPVTGEAVFGRVAPLEIEVGSGKGLFLTSAAANHPANHYLGIEIAGKYARFAAARLKKRELTNAKMIHGNAERLFDEFISDSSLAAVHVYFPDPWWKKRHKKRRIMNPTFVRHIERALEPGGRLHFWSDVEEYFQVSLDLLARETGLVGPQPVAPRAAEHDLDYRTHFERRMRLHGAKVFRSQFAKPSWVA